MSLNNIQNPKETVANLLKKIFKISTFFRIRLTIFFSLAICFTTIFYNNIVFSCISSLLQNVLLVYITILMLFSVSKISDSSERIKLGVPIATILGALYSGLTLLIGIIQYDFFGFRDRVFVGSNLVAPQITTQTILVGLASQIVLWFILTLISAGTGFLASIIYKRNISN